MEEDKSLINTFIKASIESAPQPKIYFELFKKHYISQFHTMIVIPFGLGKSSKSNEIPNSYKLINYSLPTMVGTINDKGELIESALLNCKKKVLVIDEGHRLDNKARDALLSLLSDGYYSRSLGYKMYIDKTVGSLKSGFKIKPNKSKTGFEVWAQFSCVYFCEWLPQRLLKAFLSRFSPIILNAGIDDIYNFALGKGILGTPIEQFKFNIQKNPIKIPKDIHEKFVLKHQELIKSFKSEFTKDTGGYITRNIVNLLKLACHFARLDNKNELEWKYIEKIIPLIVPTIKFTLQMKLTPRQFEIFNMIRHGMLQKDIALELGISEPSVSETIAYIRAKGLIE